MVAVFISHGGDNGNGDVVVMVVMGRLWLHRCWWQCPWNHHSTELVMPVTIDDVMGW